MHDLMKLYSKAELAPYQQFTANPFRRTLFDLDVYLDSNLPLDTIDVLVLEEPEEAK